MAVCGHSQYVLFGQWGVQTTFYFTMQDPSQVASSFYTGTGGPFAAGDATISKDGGAVVNTTNTPAQVTAVKSAYSITLTAAEMQASVVHVMLTDLTSPQIYGAVSLLIYNVISISQLNIDPTAMGGNQSGLKLRAIGTGFGLDAGGVTTALAHNLLKSAVPTAELVAVPTDLLTYEQMLQSLVKRFYNLVTQDGTNQRVYRNDSATILTTMTVNDDGSTQTKGKGA